MAVLLIILGTAFFLAGGCSLIQAAGDWNQMRAVGAAVIGIVLLVPGLLMLIFGIKRVGRKPGEAGNTRKCPHCAEMIKLEATVCRYCSRDVPPFPVDPSAYG